MAPNARSRAGRLARLFRRAYNGFRFEVSICCSKAGQGSPARGEPFQ